MTKRANGTGTVEYHRGKWRVRVVKLGKRVTLATFETREEAGRLLRAWAANVANGEIGDPSKLTFGQFGDEWLIGRELNGSRARDEVRDIANERRLWARHVATSDLAAKPVDAIDEEVVDEFVLWLRRREKVSAIRTRDGIKLRETGTTISKQTQKNVMRLVRQALAEAVRKQYLPANPAVHVRISVGEDESDLSDDWLRASEIDALLSCDAISIRNRTAYAAAIGLSLRLNDLKSIELEHVHLDAEVPGPHVRVWIKKKKRWHRVPVMPWLNPWLRAHISTLPKGSRWLFPNDDGERYGKYYDFAWAEKRQKTGKERLEPSALARAGIARSIRFHDLRGTCATHLAIGTWGRRWSLLEIQSMLAHSDQRVTERYVRRALDLLAEAAAATTGGPGCPRGGATSLASARDDSPPLRLPKPEVGSSNLPGSVEESGEGVGNGGAALVAHAETLIAAMTEGRAAEADRAAADLASLVLWTAATTRVIDDAARHAVEVLAGGEHRRRFALRLASAVLDRSGVSSAPAVTSSPTGGPQ